MERWGNRDKIKKRTYREQTIIQRKKRKNIEIQKMEIESKKEI